MIVYVLLKRYYCDTDLVAIFADEAGAEEEMDHQIARLEPDDESTYFVIKAVEVR